ncbi:MAG: sugar 3,4-ketoisomerase [Algoriphagus aquaeductus]|jgi:hypothetical protein|uniref:sugar 3,4-ketoisomerase n=1 Tax=Algoriphagus TaxID=246875 RepID=UPI0025863ED1|nr:FdtA/QdtA family cupin domain-containing protein [Algoriphagus sp.]
MQQVEISGSLELKYPKMIKIPGRDSLSGELHFWEDNTLFPQGILRCFWITGVQEGLTRGNHAHLKESQVLVALAGCAYLEVESIDGKLHSFELRHPSEGVFVPPLNWTQVKCEEGTVVLGLSDREFSEEDYIRDKSDFERLQKNFR